MRALRPLLGYLRTYRRQVVAGVATILGASVVGLATPIIIGDAVDAIREGSDLSLLGRFVGLLILVTVIRGVFNFLQRTILVTVSRRVEEDLRNDLYSHLQGLAAADTQELTVGDLMARSTNDLGAVRMLCGPAIMYSGNTVFTAIGALIFMLRIHVGLTFLALATMPLVAFATRYFGRRIHDLFEDVQARFSDLTAKAQENLAGVRVVRAYAQEPWEEETFATLNDDYVERNRRLVLWSSAFHPLLQLLVGIGFAAVLGYGGLLVIEDTISLGQFVTFHFFLLRLTWPMIAIGWVINMIQRGSASMKRLSELFDIEPSIVDGPGALTHRPTGQVHFAGLDFTYPTGPQVLSGIELAIEAGQTVAIVGRTGSGKSTLLSLVPRLWDPPAGRLFVDDLDVRELRLEDLRSAIGMVPQEAFLFSATLRENLAFGRPEASDDEILEVIRRAGLEADLELFPRGLDTVIGERGINVSGGQRQRIALARALLLEPPILILDDCFSAVDTGTEERILGHLAEATRDQTVLLVSHRVSTVQGADQILVLEQGRIAERGRHHELLARGGLYAELHRLQQLEEELATL